MCFCYILTHSCFGWYCVWSVSWLWQRVTCHTVHRCLHDKLNPRMFKLGHMLLLFLAVWGTSLCPVSKWVRFTHTLMDCVSSSLPCSPQSSCNRMLFIFVAILNEVAWNVKAVFISALGTFPMKRISDATQLPCFVSDLQSVECECWPLYTLLCVNADCGTTS